MVNTASSICHHGKNTLLGALALLLMPLPAIAGQSPAVTMVFAGSGTNLPIVRILVREFERRHPEVRIEVPESIGSTSAIRAAADGAITIGLISRPLKENEKRLGLDVVSYARTPLIIGVHPGVGEDNISYGEIVDIYRGRKVNWQDGRNIVVLTREPGDSSIEVMKKEVPGFAEAYSESQKAKRWATLLMDIEMNRTLANTPAAIGFSDLSALTAEGHRIKPLKVNGVAPTVSNALKGKYPLLKPLLFVCKREKLPPAAGEFLAFVRTKTGAGILRANGCLPER